MSVTETSRAAHGPSDRAREKVLLNRFAASRSPVVRDEIVVRFMPLARSLAMRYRTGGEPLDDLIQVANLGLIKAIDRFEPGRGTPFTAYAVPTILGELRRHFRDHVWNLRLPRALQEMTIRVDTAAEQLAGELGRPPAPSQIAEYLGLATEQVLESIAASQARRTLSIDAPAGVDEDATSPVLERIGVPELGYDRTEAQVAAGVAGLDEREWRTLRLRFVDELTQQEIGKVIGVSQMQVSRISRRALWKLLAAVRGMPADGTAPPSRPRSTHAGNGTPEPPL